MNCYYHPDREVVGMCISCGKPICAECKVVLDEKFYCNPCADKIYTDKRETENSSGQGSLAVIPSEIRGWNWGAFFLTWIWAIGNNVWIGLLALIPYFNLIWTIVLGVKGSEWAWGNKRWDSVGHFKKTQSTWTKWGVGILIFSIVVGIIVGIMVGVSLYSFGYYL